MTTLGTASTALDLRLAQSVPMAFRRIELMAGV